MSKPIGNLEEEALKRKERLKSLKRKFNETSDDTTEMKESNNSTKQAIPKPTFRSYRKDDDENVDVTESITEITEIKDQLDEMKTPLEIEDIEVNNLAPKKIDFDLKRAIAKKLQKLEKRTQIAISELIRLRLMSQKDEDFVKNVNVGAKEAAQNIDSD
ncbi:hypothetical protein PVAND_002816 [Polypedilum vanderplanki]|uniref:Uncharacterized protein n=1 Tax=Polypedilum vanderplanki TaxID=319348 RepID=A0A9J6BSJ2_POLVA|nr:hypothetical protein PVAND_002816 [Polypedilum vanderplanki]